LEQLEQGPRELSNDGVLQGPAAQEPHTAQAIESGASFMAAVTDATAPMPGMEGDPSQAQQVRSVWICVIAALGRMPTTPARVAQTFDWPGGGTHQYMVVSCTVLVSLPVQSNKL